MTIYGRAAIAALKRGPMTLAEIAFEADLHINTARQYVKYHTKTQPPSICAIGTEKSEVTGRRVTIYQVAEQ